MIERGFERRRNAVEYGVLTASTLAVAFFAGWLWRAQNQTSTLPPLFQDAPRSQIQSGANARIPAPTVSGRSSVIIHVAGAVHKPGVLTLSSNQRVNDAIRAAGGVKAGADVNALNLAARLEDGQQIRVPTKAEVVALKGAQGGEGTAASSTGPSSAVAKPGSSKPSRPINVNTASAVELEELPGIGPAIAARIVAHRTQHGRFQRMEDLDQVKGLGPKKIENLRPWVRF